MGTKSDGKRQASVLARSAARGLEIIGGDLDGPLRQVSRGSRARCRSRRRNRRRASQAEPPTEYSAASACALHPSLSRPPSREGGYHPSLLEGQDGHEAARLSKPERGQDLARET